MSCDYYGTSGPMPQQPKFKDGVRESPKDPQNTFRTMSWMCTSGGIIANYNLGPQLERVPRPVPSLRSTGSHYAALVSHGPEAVT